jgi:hypothetical protein
MKKLLNSLWAGLCCGFLAAAGGTAGFVQNAYAEAEPRIVSTKDVPRQEAAIVCGGFPIGRWDVHRALDHGNREWGFGPGNMPSGVNWSASQANLGKMVDFNSAFGKECLVEVVENGQVLAKFTVQHVCAPLKPNRLDGSVSGILYATRELTSGLVRYRVVARFQNRPDYLREVGVMENGKFYEMSRKHGDASFAMTFDTIMKKDHPRAYQQLVADMAGTPSLFSQAFVLIAGDKHPKIKQASRIKADAKKVSDALKEFRSAVQSLIEAIQKLYSALKKLWDVVKGLLCSWLGWLCLLEAPTVSEYGALAFLPPSEPDAAAGPESAYAMLAC